MCRCSIHSLLFFLMPILPLIACLLYCIPEMFAKFELWKKNHISGWFSVSVFLGFATITSLAFFYLAYFQIYLHYKALIQSEILKLALLVATIWLSYAVFIPKTLWYFQHWHRHKRSIDFSRSEER